MRRFKTIHIPIPKNISERYRKLFEKKSSYKVPELGVKKYKNVFVSHEGLCLQNFRLIPYSSFNIRTSYDKSFGWQYYKLVLEQYLVSTFGKSLKKITLDSDTRYAIIHTKWFNYSFWITSSLHRLIMLYESGKDFTLIYPEEWDNIPYVTESLKAFPGLKIKIIPQGTHMQIPHLLMPEVRPFTACFDGTELQTVRNYFTARIPAEFLNKTYPDKVYITRKKAKYRKVENEQELISHLIPKGFTVLDFDDLSFWEQVAYMQYAKIFVSIHGAGCSNIIFMPPQSTVVELINAFYAELEYTFPFWKQAHVCGHSYFPVFGESIQKTSSLITSQNTAHSSDFLVNQNIIVNVQEVEIIPIMKL
ncbi:MAG: glycosyltransferase family 61 protein [Bacteroidales bacterium]|jgi:hypothetical protein|nr:glycosyltransferase family 61 protein [Bacteroidales bacterium]